MAALGNPASQLLSPELFSYSASFRTNVHEFLRAHGREVQLGILHIRCWIVALSDGTQLQVYSQDVCESTLFCDQCRIIGWGTHPVSRVRYHFIVPAEVGIDSLEDPTSLAAIAATCASGQHSATVRVILPRETAAAAADTHISPYNAPSTIFDSTRHRLHGLLHANGYGHLLRVNGRQGGSRSHTGLQLTQLWDVLCRGLRVRQVTTEDVSNKAGMDLRVLHTAAHGVTWYGQFGYRFGRGVFNTGELAWEAAGKYVQCASLPHLLHDFEGVDERVLAIVRRYRLPVVPGAARVTTLGVLLYRLMYLHAHPAEALPFFDQKQVDKASKVVEADEQADVEKRAAQRAATAAKKAAESMRRRASAAIGAATAAAARPQLKLKLKVASPARPTANAPAAAVLSLRARQRQAESAAPVGNKAAAVPASPSASKARKRDRSPSSPVYGEELVGRRVRVYDKPRRTYYSGAVRKFVAATGQHSVELNHGTFSYDLHTTPVEVLDSPRQPPAGATKPKVPPPPVSPRGTVVTSPPPATQQQHLAEKPPAEEPLAKRLRTTRGPAPAAAPPAAAAAPAPVLPNLNYKAVLARNDAVERYRALARAIKNLVPAAVPLLQQAKSKGDLDAAFSKFAGKHAPRPQDSDGEWWKYLPVLLDWAQEVLGMDTRTTRASATVTVADRMEVDRAALHAMGIFPEAWTMPLTPASVRSANQAAAAAAQSRATPAGPTNAAVADNDRRRNPPRQQQRLHEEEEEEDDEDPSVSAHRPRRGAQAPAAAAAAGKASGSRSAAGGATGQGRQGPIKLGCARCRLTQCTCCRHRAAIQLRESGDAQLAKMLGCKVCRNKEDGCRRCWATVLAALKAGDTRGAGAAASKAPASLAAGSAPVVAAVEEGVLRERSGKRKGKPPVAAQAADNAPAAAARIERTPALPESPRKRPARTLTSTELAAAVPRTCTSDHDVGAAALPATVENPSAQEPAAAAAPSADAAPAPEQSKAPAGAAVTAEADDSAPLVLTSEQQMLPDSHFPHPPACQLPPLQLPDEPLAFPRDRVMQAIRAVMDIARAHQNTWVARQRLADLTLCGKGVKSAALVALAIRLMTRAVHEGWGLHMAVNPELRNHEFFLAESVAASDASAEAGVQPSLEASAPVQAPKVEEEPALEQEEVQAKEEPAAAAASADASPSLPARPPSSRRAVLTAAAEAKQAEAELKTQQAQQAAAARAAKQAEAAATRPTTIKLHLPARATRACPPPAEALPPAPPAAPRQPAERTPAQQAAVDAALAVALAPVQQLPASSLRPDAAAAAAAASLAAQPWMQLTPGATPPQPVTVEAARHQVMRDLHHLYIAVFRVYAPELANKAVADAAVAAGERPPLGRQLKLKQMAAEVQVLRDAKHFLADCSGQHPLQGPPPPPGSLLVWVKLAAPLELVAPPLSSTRFGRKFLPVEPPPELLVLPASGTVGDLLAAATAAYRELYCMCTAAFTIDTIVSGLTVTGSAGVWDPATSLAAALPSPGAGAAPHSGPGTSASASSAAGKGVVPVVTVAGSGLDTSPQWLHAGGPEDWIVACPCGTRDDDGEAMVACDRCQMWMHTRCMGVPDDSPSFVCPACIKRQRAVA